MSQEGVAVVDVSEHFPSPTASSQFEDQREEEQKKEEHDYFNDDVSDLEEEKEGAYNAPEENLNTVLCSRLFDKGQKLKLFNDCYDQRHVFIPALCRSNSDLRKKLELLLRYRLIKERSNVPLIAQKLSLLFHYVLEAGEINLALPRYDQLIAARDRLLIEVQSKNDAAQAIRGLSQRWTFSS